jgi:hypothetical protein
MRFFLSPFFLLLSLGVLVWMIGLIMHESDPVFNGMYKAVAIFSTCFILHLAGKDKQRS